MRKKKTELLVVVSDLHCGSHVALAPPETETHTGNVVGFGKNIHQEWLWENWLEMVKKVGSICNGDRAALVVNGDATEGAHHRNNAELVASEIEVHATMAKECLTPLLDICHKSYVVKGTECHTRDMESYLAKLIEAEGCSAKDKWLLDFSGCLVDAAHHMGTSSRSYLEASLLSITMGNANLNYVRAGHRVPSVYLRAHRHCHGVYSDGKSMIAVTGAWQWLTRHGHKVVQTSIPRPSAVVMDWRGRPSGALPHCHEIIFNTPQHEITHV